MSKFKKEPEIKSKKKGKSRSKEDFAYKTVVISAILGGFFLLVSLLFNGYIITIFMDIDLLFDIIDVSIKVGVILLFFLFTIISTGNYKELTGKPVELRDITLIFFLALLQSILHPYVFLLTFIGLIIIIFYLYLVQDN